jgi:chemotaxis family two-component system sensor kinase Cph1
VKEPADAGRTDCGPSADPKAELAASGAATDDFLRAAVHDLRGPLSQVRALTILLGRQHKAALNADGQELCGLIEAASKRAVDVVDSIYAYAQVLETPVFELANLNAIVDSARYALQSVIEENPATVTRDDLPSIRGDCAKLLLLFRELLRNALKFRGEAPPSIHCSAQNYDRWVLFSVADNGVGVPENKSELIFKPLRRLHGQAHEGTGMGLAICRRIVEMHGGRIWVESRPAGGADFRFTVPTSSQD